MGFLGRFYSERDMATLISLNRELLNDIIETIVIVYKISAYDTKVNLYGESDTKMYYPGVQLYSLIEHPDPSTNNEDFGPDKIKVIRFRFSEDTCKREQIYPEIGDVVQWDNSYYEINNVMQEQHLGGVSEKSWSIIVDSHLSRLSRLNIEERQL